VSRFSSPEEYMEKLGAGTMKAPGIGGKLTGGMVQLSGTSELGALGKWLKSLSMPKRVGLGVGAAGLLGLGAVGMGGLLGGDRPGDTISYRVNRGMHGLLDRIRADEQVGESFAKGIGSGAAESLMGLTKDIITKGYESMKDTLALSPVRRKIFSVLKKEDDIINMADNKTLMEAYHTMSNVAPRLSTDKNAVKSVLRMAATSGGGLDYTTIKGIADAETAVAKAKYEGGGI
jgi:hypothetical protein